MTAVTITPHCRRQLKRLPRTAGGRDGLQKINAMICAIAEGRMPAGARRIKSHGSAWRCAAGDWRVIFLPAQRGEPPTVIAAGNRTDLYKREGIVQCP